MAITQITQDIIADGAVGTAQLAAGALSADATGRAKMADLFVTPAKIAQPLTFGTVQASTSLTARNFPDIPAWARRVTISLNGVSLSGTALIRFRLGTSGGLATSGYNGAGSVIAASVATANQTAGFDIYTNVPNAGYAYSGALVLTEIDATNNIWAASGVFATHSVNWTHTVAGVVALSGTLTQVSVVSSNGTDTFDAGSINILYE